MNKYLFAIFTLIVASISFGQTAINTQNGFRICDISPNGQYLVGLKISLSPPINTSGYTSNPFVEKRGQVQLFNLSNSTTTIIPSAIISAPSVLWGDIHFTPDGKKVYFSLLADSVTVKTYYYDVTSYVSISPQPLEKNMATSSDTKIYPIPSTGSTPINFEVPSSSGSLKIEIANLQGSIVRVLYSGNSDRIVWDKKNQYGDAVPSGQYVARIISGKTVKSKMVCITE
jgi:hypothetical protein